MGASLLLALACGSTTIKSESSAGSGGVSSAGAIGGAIQSGGVSDGGSAGDDTATGQCHFADTRLCVGPAACKGGQTCGADQRWGACDCGNGGSTAGGGGSGGSSGGAGGSSGEVIVPEGGSSGDPGGGEAGNGEAGSGGSGPADEPCPAGPIATDCSGQCTTKPALCDGSCPLTVPLSLTGTGGVFARTPSNPGNKCDCGPNSTAYSMGFQFTPANHTFYMLCVPEPWHITELFINACTIIQPPQCVRLNVGAKKFSVWTSDPNAPAINLTAEIDQNPM